MKQTLFILPLLIFISQQVTSQVITIGDTGDYPTLEAAENFVTSGDTLLLQSQVFSDGTQFLNNLNGTLANPIVIMADTEHQSIFRGETEAIHLTDCSHVILDGLVVEQQTGNGINIDDGSDYSTPSTYITVRNCIFRGGTEAIHLIDCSHLILDGLVVEQQTGNGINIDDGGDYNTPSTKVTVRNCIFRDMAATGVLVAFKTKEAHNTSVYRETYLII